MQQAPETPYYHYDERLGDPRAAYVSTANARPGFGRPEMPATFAVTVEGESWLNSMWGARRVPWRAEPGTECVILGYWSDATVRLSWPAIRGAYHVVGRFPAWVVIEDPNAPMAAGGHILKANDPPVRRPPMKRLVAFVSHVLRMHH